MHLTTFAFEEQNLKALARFALSGTSSLTDSEHLLATCIPVPLYHFIVPLHLFLFDREISQALLGSAAAESGANAYTLRRLKADVQMQLTAFKNAAYTAGYTAGKDEVVAYATRRYA
eukprot:gene6356-6589_t